MAQHIQVVPYDPAWPAQFEREAALLTHIFGGELVAVYHIGSTSVPGLAAKPIIDILPVASHIEQVESHYAELENIGYECLGEFGIPGRRYCRKGGVERTHQLHFFDQTNTRDIVRHLAVRDYLRTHPADAAQYAALKIRLAQQFPYDIEAYCDGKADFVQALERRAVTWWHETGKSCT